MKHLVVSFLVDFYFFKFPKSKKLLRRWYRPVLPASCSREWDHLLAKHLSPFAGADSTDEFAGADSEAAAEGS